jgi:hypothetical protein
MALPPITPDAGAPPSPGLAGFAPESFGVVGFGRMAQALLLPLIDGGLVPATGVRAVVGTAASAARLAAQSEPQALNLARPPFNIILTWKDSGDAEQSEILFDAFRELRGAPHTQVMDHHVLLRSDPQLHRMAKGSDGEIWFKTPSGKNVDINLIFENETSKFETRASLPVKIGNVPITLKIWVDGRVLIRDSNEREIILRIRDWPAVRWSAGRKPMSPISMLVEKRALLPDYYDNDRKHK